MSFANADVYAGVKVKRRMKIITILKGRLGDLDNLLSLIATIVGVYSYY